MRNLMPYGRKNLMKEFMKNFMSDDFDFGFQDLLPDFFGAQSMKTDIRETDNEYIMELEVPGFTKDQIDINIADGYITVKAKRQDEIKEEREGYLRRERNFGQFQRTFKLHNVKEDQIKAKYKNGILEIVLPKIKKGKDSARKIDIE